MVTDTGIDGAVFKTYIVGDEATDLIKATGYEGTHTIASARRGSAWRRCGSSNMCADQDRVHHGPQVLGRETMGKLIDAGMTVARSFSRRPRRAPGRSRSAGVAEKECSGAGHKGQVPPCSGPRAHRARGRAGDHVPPGPDVTPPLRGTRPRESDGCSRQAVPVGEAWQRAAVCGRLRRHQVLSHR